LLITSIAEDFLKTYRGKLEDPDEALTPKNFLKVPFMFLENIKDMTLMTPVAWRQNICAIL
jgi:hypothetical protein